MAAIRGRQITNFGGFFDPFAIGGGPLVVIGTVEISDREWPYSLTVTLPSIYELSAWDATPIGLTASDSTACDLATSDQAVADLTIEDVRL